MGFQYPFNDLFTQPPEIDSFNFITFNYNANVNNIFNKIKAKKRCDSFFDKVDSRKNMIHKTCERGFVLGVNDKTQITNGDFASDADICNLLIKENQQKIADCPTNLSEFIEDSKIVYVYGMSIGETDKKYWEELVKWLLDCDERLLVVSKYDKDVTGIDTSRLAKKVKDVKDKLVLYGATTSCLDRVKVVINPRIFDFTKKGRRKRRFWSGGRKI